MNKIHVSILYIIITLIVVKGYSQNNNVKPLEIMHTINRLGKLNIKSFAIENKLPSTYIIGFFNKKKSNTPTKIIPPNGTISDYVLDYLKSALQGHLNSEGENIKFILNEFSAGQDSSQEETLSYAKLNADVFETLPTGDSTYLGTYDSTIISQNQNTGLGGQISDLLFGLIKFSNGLLISTSAKGTNTFINSRIKLKNRQEPTQNRITKETTYPTGIYTSFKQFLDDAPAITSFRVSFDTKTDSVAFFKIDSKDSSGTAIDSIWGLAAGNELYKYSNGSIVPIEKLDNGFFLSKYVDPKLRKNHASFWRNNIGNKTDTHNPFDNKYNVTVKIKNGLEFQATRIDMRTGNLTF